MAEPRAESDALVKALTALAPLVRHGLWGANVPIGMDKPVTQQTTDESIVKAQDEYVRRALWWVATAHPNAVRTALADVVLRPVSSTPEEGSRG